MHLESQLIFFGGEFCGDVMRVGHSKGQHSCVGSVIGELLTNQWVVCFRVS